MRLIDADALKEVIFSKSESMEDLWDTAGVLNVINNAPTVHTEDCEGCPYCPNSNSGIPIGVE